MSRQQLLAAVSAANVRRHVEHITTQIPSRLAGSPNARRMAEYSRGALLQSGAEARIHEMPGLVSFPDKGEFRVLAPRELAIEANTLGHSVPTLPDGISGELIDVASAARSTIRRPRRDRQDHAVRTLLPARPPREAAHRRHARRDRLRDDELGA